MILNTFNRKSKKQLYLLQRARINGLSLPFSPYLPMVCSLFLFFPNLELSSLVFRSAFLKKWIHLLWKGRKLFLLQSVFRLRQHLPTQSEYSLCFFLLTMIFLIWSFVHSEIAKSAKPTGLVVLSDPQHPEKVFIGPYPAAYNGQFPFCLVPLNN